MNSEAILVGSDTFEVHDNGESEHGTRVPGDIITVMMSDLATEWCLSDNATTKAS